MKKRFTYSYRLYQVDDKGMIEYYKKGFYDPYVVDFNSEEEAMDAIPKYESWSIQKIITWVEDDTE